MRIKFCVTGGICIVLENLFCIIVSMYGVSVAGQKYGKKLFAF